MASLRRYVAANLPEEARRAQVRVLRLDPAVPGQEAQIDYGQLGRWADPVDRAAARVIGRSRWCCAARGCLFVRPVIKMDQRAWTECHVAAFEFFGGVPARLVPDNLKTGVDRPDLYDPRINRSYAELAAHYGCLVDPARSRKPRDKAQVERPMPYIRDSFWRGREFTCLEQMQAEAVRWCSEVAGQRACRPLDGAAPAAVFEAAEKDRAGAAAAQTRSCSRNGRGARSAPTSTSRSARACTRCRGSTSARPSTPGRPRRWCSCSAGGDLVKTHVRKPRGKQTDLGDYPPEKIAFRMRTPAWCRRRAAEIGPACAALIAGLLADNALYRLRAAQGVLGLADKHQPGRLEAACAKATAAGDPSYRTVKGILAAGTETSPVHRARRGRRRRRVPARPRGAVRRRGNVVPLRPCRFPAPRRRHDRPHRDHRRRGAHAHHGRPRTPSVTARRGGPRP